MDPERIEAFEKLRVSADSILSRPEEASVRVAGPRGRLECSIITRPSFAPSVAWAILRTRPDPSGNASRRICRVSWDSSRDLERLNSTAAPAAFKVLPLEPSIDVRVIDAPSEVADWLTELGGVRVPPLCAADAIGLDGESTTVQLGEGLHSCVFRWWCTGPDEWAPLVDWAGRVRSRLDALLQGS